MVWVSEWGCCSSPHPDSFNSLHQLFMCLSLWVNALLDQEKKHTMYSVGRMARLMRGLPDQSWLEPVKLSPSRQSSPHLHTNNWIKRLYNAQVGLAICRSLGWHHWTHTTEVSALTLLYMPRLPLKWLCDILCSGIFQSHDKTTSLWNCKSLTCVPMVESQDRKWKNTSLLLSSNQWALKTGLFCKPTAQE